MNASAPTASRFGPLKRIHWPRVPIPRGTYYSYSGKGSLNVICPAVKGQADPLASMGRPDQAGVVGGDDELGAIACIEFREQAA